MLVLNLRKDKEIVMSVGGTALVRVRYLGRSRIGLIAGSDVIIVRNKEEDEEKDDSGISEEE